MKAIDLLGWLQGWYAGQCDGDWEHQCGIRLQTLGNPGWWLSVDLAGTELWDRSFTPVRRGNPESDAEGLLCRVEGGRWEGSGGAGNLGEILTTFRNWAVD